MAFNTGSIATRALNYVQDVPSAISGNATLFAEESIHSVNSRLKLSLGTTGIDEKYSTILINLTAAKLLGAMTGIGADFGYRIGEIDIRKGAEGREVRQQMYHLQVAENELKHFRKPVWVKKANG